MKMAVETAVNAKLNTVWDVWNNPEDIKQWNAPQDDWHTTSSDVDLREGGKFKARMEAKDGSEGWQNILDNFGRHVETRRSAG